MDTPVAVETKPWLKWYEEGVPQSIRYTERSIPGNLFATAARHAGRKALVFENGEFTYGQLEDAVRRFAAALASLGVTRGSRLAIQLPNLPQTVIAYYAGLALGAEVVMTNPLYVEREIVHQWNDAGVEVAVVGDWLFEQRVRGIRDKLAVKHYITTAIADTLQAPLRWLARIKLSREGLAAKVAPEPNVHDFMQLLQSHEPWRDFEEPDLDSVAVLQYTGGTTGLSKGAMLTHRNLSCNVQQTISWFPSLKPGEDTWLACLPFFHIFGMTVSLNWAVAMGGTIILMANPRDIPKMISLIAKHRVSIYPSLPALFNAVLNHPSSKKVDLTSVKGCFSGSAPLPVQIMEDFEKLTGGRIVEGFGLTETSPVTHCNPVKGKRKPGSIGIPIPDTEARVVDMVEGTRDVPSGEEGELILRGPQVMKGYWNRPKDTDATLRNGWLYTGDLARMDEEGYFWICGRKKEMILASGYNVYPDEVDRVLMSHPKILESATIGIPDPKRGETVKSFVVLKAGVNATEDEIIAFCKEELAAYKVPKALEFRKELPKSAVQKVLRRELKDEEMRKRSSDESAGMS
ncbi:MAG: long-chain fatty acid--CoA ligase [Thermoanaerobaculia bacterium]